MDSALSAQREQGEARGPSAFVYFYDPVDIARSVPGWPPAIQLAICLAADGICDFVLFHEDEAHRILDRVGRVLGRDAGDFGTSPEIDGYPERRLVYSEEATLIREMEGEDDLLDRAEDYEANYRFACEEGLDPETVCVAVEPEETDDLHRASLGKIFPMASRRPAAAPTVPDSYHRVATDEVVRFDARLRRVGQRLRLEGEDRSGPAVFTDEIAVRDDLRAFHLPASVLGGQGAAALPVDMPVELFPDAFVSHGVVEARVTVMPSGVFVSPVLAMRQEVAAPPVAPIDPRVEVTRIAAMVRRLGHGLRVPMLAVGSLVAMGFFSAMVASTVSEAPVTRLWSGATPTVDVFGAEKHQAR